MAYSVNGLSVVLEAGGSAVLASAAEIQVALNRHYMLARMATGKRVLSQKADQSLTSSQLLESGLESQRMVQVFS